VDGGGDGGADGDESETVMARPFVYTWTRATSPNLLKQRFTPSTSAASSVGIRMIPTLIYLPLNTTDACLPANR
jgi:hypothetical protein